jgi:hypothetical protein
VPKETITRTDDAVSRGGAGRVRRQQLGIVASIARLPRTLVRERDLLADQGVEAMPTDHGFELTILRGATQRTIHVQAADLLRGSALRMELPCRQLGKER